MWYIKGDAEGNESNTTKGRTMNATQGRYPNHDLLQYPNGSWGFCGKVDVDLAYVQEDGTKATDSQLETAAKRGPQIAGLKTRTWVTREAALAALADYEKSKTMTGLTLYDCVEGRELEVLVDDKWVRMTVGAIRIFHKRLSDGNHPHLSIAMIPLDHNLRDKIYCRLPHELRFPE